MVTAFHSFVLASNLKRMQPRHPMLVLPEVYVPKYNIKHGDATFVITGDKPKQLQQFEFGLRGFKTVMPFLRAEGNRNPEDDLKYNGAKAIFLQPGFKQLIRTHRCLVPADAFITGNPEAPYLVYLRNKQRPFCFAGIWNKTAHEETGTEVFSFGIITVTANELMAGFGVKRMPVIVHYNDERKWLNPAANLSEITRIMDAYPIQQMNAYPIAPMEMESDNSISIIQPKGEPVFDETFNLRLPRIKKGKTFTSKVQLSERGKAI